MDLELQGRTAIVTGGSSGIGKAVALELAMEGVDVAIAARRPEPLEAAARELAEASGRRIIPIPADTSDDDSVKAMVQSAVDALGRLDILVNCAAQPGGAAPAVPLSDIVSDHFWPDMNVKVLGYLRCAREAAPPHGATGMGAHHQHQRPRCSADWQHHREHEETWPYPP